MLQVDLGNSRIKWRVRHLSNTLDFGHQKNDEGFASLEEKLRNYEVESVWVVSVVGDEQEHEFFLWVQAFFNVEAKFVRAELTCCGVKNGYTDPSKLGADRWVGIVAGYTRIRQSLVLVDCGSAITVDVVTDDGEHRGGYIAPGLEMVRRNFSRDTHRVRLSESSEFDVEFAPGCDTAAAVEAAQSVMVTSLVRQAYNYLVESSSGGRTPRIIMTGGDAPIFAHAFPEVLLVSDLILDGLELIAASV